MCTAILNHTRHTTEAKRVYITKPILRKYPCLGEKKIFETSGTWIVFFKTSYSPSALERTCNNWYVKIHGVICRLYTLSIWKLSSWMDSIFNVLDFPKKVSFLWWKYAQKHTNCSTVPKNHLIIPFFSSVVVKQQQNWRILPYQTLLFEYCYQSPVV